MTNTQQMEIIAEIDDRYKLVQKLGKGGTAVVYLGYDNALKPNDTEEPQLFAFKVMKNSKRNEDDLISESFDNEIKSLNKLYRDSSFNFDNSSNALLKKKGGKSTEVSFVKIEYFSNGELFDYVYFPKKGLGENFSRLIFKSILLEVNKLHELNIVHRDLKTENIMLDKEYNVRLCDYGFSVENSSHLSTFCGTSGYMSPELMYKVPYNGKPNDVFALGVVLFVLVTGQMPFRNSSPNDQHYGFIARGKYEQFWKLSNMRLSEGLKQLINGLLSFDPTLRPTISEILYSPWMLEGDFNDNNYKVLKEELINRKSIISQKKKKM